MAKNTKVKETKKMGCCGEKEEKNCEESGSCGKSSGCCCEE